MRNILSHSIIHPLHICLEATQDTGSSSLVARVPSRPQAELGRLGTRATLFWADFKDEKNIHFFVKNQGIKIDINSYQTKAAKSLTDV